MIHWQKPPRRRHLSRALWAGPIVLALGAATLAQGSASPVLINESDSLPRGLYWRAASEPKLGSVVAVAQPASARSYLAGLGVPPDVLLIKRVAATGGDSVCRGRDRFATPRGRHPVLERDRLGRSLPTWAGCRPLRPGELFLLGDTDTSFDSRYFGPVPRSAVVGVYREGPTW